MTPKRMELSPSAVPYACELVADKLSPEYRQHEEFESFAMRRGTRLEGQARKWLEFALDQDVTQVGLVISKCGRMACSPDGLFGLEGGEEGLELKALMPKSHVLALNSGEIPSEYLTQVHGSMIVTGRRRWTFVSWCPELPPLVVKVAWSSYTDKLAEALEKFHDLHAGILKKIQEM